MNYFKQYRIESSNKSDKMPGRMLTDKLSSLFENFLFIENSIRLIL